MVQGKIASILSAYDDLIENNRRRMQLLEQAARLLYQEWFVRLRFPGHEHVKIKDGVPGGWEEKKIEDTCETIGGGTPSTSNPGYWEGRDVTWVIPTDVTRNDCLALIDSEKKITHSGLRSSSARLVPPETILMTSRASVGFFAMMDKEVCTNQGLINIVPYEPWFRMYLLHNLMYRVKEIRSHAGGATYKEISKGRFRQMTIIDPPKPVAQEFDGIAYQLLQQVRVLKKHN
jgi:type I restriction enzyme, S subunit